MRHSRAAQRVWRWLWYRGRQQRVLLRKMDHAKNCAEWRSHGALLDRYARAHAWVVCDKMTADALCL